MSDSDTDNDLLRTIADIARGPSVSERLEQEKNTCPKHQCALADVEGLPGWLECLQCDAEERAELGAIAKAMGA